MSELKTITVSNPTEVLIRVAGPGGSLVPFEAGQTQDVPEFMADACKAALLTVKGGKKEAQVKTDKK
ncbi:MAG: hypothetical protein GY746_11130 [Gammaproteobacteria bacterium]|nr:hypothetical protein [Gammaproteobacteria bacterium]